MIHTIDANGASIPAIGLGTWTLRGAECTGLVEHALDVGYRHLDTAASYENETEIGAAVRASGLARSELFVTTKVWYTDIAPGDFERSAEASLKRLGLDHVDLLLIHWPSKTIPLEGPIQSLNGALERGYTKNIGVSNFPTDLLTRAIELSEHDLACNQVEYHPMLSQDKVHALCRKAGMAMVSYCPLHRGGGLFEEPAVRSAAQNHGRTPAQIVLRWHVQQEGVAAIPRTTKKERLAENIAIFDFALSEEEMRAISALRSANSRICDYAFSPDWDRA